MNYETVAVTIEGGKVIVQDNRPLPNGEGILLIQRPVPSEPDRASSGLRRFLSEADFPLSKEQFEASMKSDYFDQ